MYAKEELDEDSDNGTMPDNVQELADAVVGHRIVAVQQRDAQNHNWNGVGDGALIITLDNGRRVELIDTGDCCAYTELENFLLHPERVDHVILGVGTTGQYSEWHIYADMGDVLTLSVGWSAGNPFYYGYGFKISVKDIETEQ